MLDTDYIANVREQAEKQPERIRAAYVRGWISVGRELYGKKDPHFEDLTNLMKEFKKAQES